MNDFTSYICPLCTPLQNLHVWHRDLNESMKVCSKKCQQMNSTRA